MVLYSARALEPDSARTNPGILDSDSGFCILPELPSRTPHAPTLVFRILILAGFCILPEPSSRPDSARTNPGILDSDSGFCTLPEISNRTPHAPPWDSGFCFWFLHSARDFEPDSHAPTWDSGF